jgi:hypothetical protein
MFITNNLANYMIVEINQDASETLTVIESRPNSRWKTDITAIKIKIKLYSCFGWDWIRGKDYQATGLNVYCMKPVLVNAVFEAIL